jgi:hypothetical protein
LLAIDWTRDSGGILEEVIGIKDVIAQEKIRITMIRIRARLQGDLDVATAVPSL